MAAAYEKLEADMSEALKAHRGNRSVLSIMLNALLLYPDHPHGLGRLWGTEIDDDGYRQRFLIAETEDLPQQFAYAKERKLLEEIKKELAEGRRVQVFAVYTQKREVTSRLERMLREHGIACAVMRSSIDTAKREAWYERRIKEGVQVFIAHPKLVETGLDLLFAPTIIFYESGYSLHTLRQASRRSWRIGQCQPVRVKFLCYEATMQARCLRLMGKKLLVALAMEGKFAGEGLQTLDEDLDDDMLTSLAKELVEKNGIGESADAVWKQLNGEHQRLSPTRLETDRSPAFDIPQVPELEMQTSSHSLIEAALNSQSVLVLGKKAEALRTQRRRPRAAAPEQGSLFNWN